MKKLSIASGLSFSFGLMLASGSLFAQQYTLSTIAGDGTAGYNGDQGLAPFAELSDPTRVALDSAGNVYVIDLGNSVIREISTSGNISTVVGNGSPGYAGDGAAATAAELAAPGDLAIDSSNNIYIADTGNSRVRIVSNGIIQTFAGTGVRGIEGANLGDGGPAANAQFIEPTGVAVDKSGNVYIADIGNATVRKVAPNGIITTIAGTGFLSFGAYTGEGGPATQALLGQPYSVTVDSAGNLYIVDIGLSRLFRIGSDGLIHTVSPNFVGQNCAVDAAGNIYTGVYANNTVQKIIPNGTTLWIAGNGISGYVGDGSVGTSGSMGDPYGVAIDKSGNVYVAEGSNSVVRKLTPVPNSIGAVANAATNQPFAAPISGTGDATVPISPGELVTLFVNGFGPSTLAVNTAQNGYFSNNLAGTTVSIGGIPAPIIYTSSAFISAIVPYEISGMTAANISVSYQGQTSATVSVPVALTAPGVFTLNSTGFGQTLAVNYRVGTDNKGNVTVTYNGVNSASNPVAANPTLAANEVSAYDGVYFYVTGEGQTSPAGVDGKLTIGNTTHPQNAVTATVNGASAAIDGAVEAPSIVAGVLQVNMEIPSTTSSGTANVQVSTNTLLSPVVTIAIQ